MQVFSTRIDGVKTIQPKIFTDSRGFFLETFEKRRYQELLDIDYDFVQDNHSYSKKHVLRGLHFQEQHPQGKLVNIVHGCIFDVVIDLREESSTFGQWESFILSEENKTQVWIPPRFAHGFLVLSEQASLLYKCTDYYFPEDEKTILWCDTALNIDWSLPSPPILSEKDRNASLFSELFSNDLIQKQTKK